MKEVEHCVSSCLSVYLWINTHNLPAVLYKSGTIILLQLSARKDIRNQTVTSLISVRNGTDKRVVTAMARFDFLECKYVVAKLLFARRGQTVVAKLNNLHRVSQ